MPRFRWWAAGAALLLTALPLSAQESSPAQTDTADVDLIVTAERTAQPVAESIASASVVTAKEIKERGAVTVADAIRMVPGVTIDQSGQTGSLSIAHLRGTTMEQVLVLMDGKRITSSAFSGSADLSKLLVDNVARIEVIRGPVSSLYGSEAIGGVINIITKSPSGQSGDVAVGFGGNERVQRSATVRSSNDRMSWQFTGSTPQYSGDRNNSEYSATDLATRLTLNNVAGWEVTAGASSYHDALELPGMTTWLTPHDKQWWKREGVDLSAKRNLGAGELEWRLYDLKQRLTELDPDNYVDTRITGKTQAAEITYRLPVKGHQLIFGGEYRDENYQDIEWDTLIQDKGIDSRALFAQDRFSIDPKTACVLGLRVDDHSTSGTRATPRIGLTRAIGAASHVRASYSGGFRSPSLVELYYDNFGTKGNPNLKPETSEQFEVGLNTKIGRDTLDLAIFTSHVRNQIAWVSTDPITYAGTFDNLQRTKQHGVEITWSHPLSEISDLAVSYAHIDAWNTGDDIPIYGVPHNQLSVTGSTKLGRVKAALSARCFDSRRFSGGTAGGFTVFDLNLLYSKNTGTRPYITIRNLTDKEYQEVLYYPAEGRSIEMGVRSSW